VTGFTSFFFADDMVAALREAARVARAGRAGRHPGVRAAGACELEAVKLAVAAYRPARRGAVLAPGLVDEMRRGRG
jgi:hypothetical protein